MKINLILAIILLVMFFLVIPTLTIIIFFRHKKVMKVLGICYFVVFLIILCALVFGDVKINKGVVSLIFVTNGKWFSLYPSLYNFEVLHVFYNLVMLIPVGSFVILLNFKRPLFNAVLIAFIISLFIETFQFILPIRRCTELFDLIANVLSGILGFIYFDIIEKIVLKFQKY